MSNQELKDLKTHANGMTDSHEGTHLDHSVQIEPAHSNPSEYDVSTGKFKNNIPSGSKQKK